MTKAQTNMIGRIEKIGFKLPASGGSRSNPYTGKTHTLTPLACQLYDFITTRFHTCGVDYTRQDWDRARYMFAELWPTEYFDLLD